MARHGTAFLPRLAVILHDLTMVWFAWLLLHMARYAVTDVSVGTPFFSWQAAVVVVMQGAVFWWCGLYRGIWRFASVADLANIFKATFIGIVAIVLALAWNRFDGVPLSVLALYPILLAALLGGPRLIYRAWSDYRASRNDGAAQRVLILGAGATASALIRDLARSEGYVPIGLLDDAAYLKGAKLQGVPILGSLAALPETARETAADLLVIAMPGMESEAFDRIFALCEKTGLPYRIAPTVDDVLAANTPQLKEVAIEDLLGRKPVQTDWSPIRKWLSGKTLLVTGAGGSIGSELCRLCVQHGARRIILLELSELSLLTIEEELRGLNADVDIVPVLGDCGDPAVIRHALRLASVSAVFHAAAYKQVPVLEGQLREAVRNNALSTLRVAEAAIEANVDQFVLISSDKAVNPINALGLTKRCAELVCQAMGQQATATRFTTVRFGNVLGSAGSVVPLFERQIRLGGPVTVTDPAVSRYFMTIPEACQLILQAAHNAGKHGIYTLDMGEPVPIVLLAENMIRLAGKVPGRDVKIVFTGLRPGEKLHENLFYQDEEHRPTRHPKIYEGSLRSISRDAFLELMRHMQKAVEQYDLTKIELLLTQLVPEAGAVASFDRTVRSKVVPFVGRDAAQK